MKSINVGILGGGDVATNLITYLIEYPFFNIVKIGVRDLEKFRYFDRFGFTKTNNLEEIINDPTIDVIVECLPDIEPAHSLIIKSVVAGKDVVSCNKKLWNRPESQEMIDAAMQSNKTIWLNSIVAARNGDDLVLPTDLTHKTIKNYPADVLYVNRNSEGLHTGMAIAKDLFRVLILNRNFEVKFHLDELKKVYSNKVRIINEDVVIIDNFLEDRENSILKEIINSVSNDDIGKYIQYKKMEEYKHYCRVFLNRTDYENAYNEGAVYKGLELFKVTEAVPLPEDIAEEVSSRINKFFSGPVISTNFIESRFLPTLDGETSIVKSLDRTDLLTSSYKCIYFVNMPNETTKFDFESKQLPLDLKPNSLLIYNASLKEYAYTLTADQNNRAYFLENTIWSDVYGTKTT
jgi:hypothetical protein